MDVSTAERERTIRFYRWAVEKVKDELSSNFLLLRKCHNLQAYNFVRALERVSRIEQKQLMTARIRAAHPVALSFLGDSVSEEEKAFFQESSKAIFLDDLPGKMRRYQDECFGSTNTQTRMTHRQLLSCVVSKLTPTLGVKPIREEGEYSYISRFGDWNIETHLSTGSRQIRRIDYYHHIWRSDYDKSDVFGDRKLSITRLSIHGRTDFYRLLGLGMSNWEGYWEEQTEAITSDMVDVMLSFYIQIPQLLQGLQIND